MQLNENRIREYAYHIWEAEGKPNGCADEHWYKACQTLEAEEQSSEEHHSDNFIPHQNSKKGKHAHHPHQPQHH